MSKRSLHVTTLVLFLALMGQGVASLPTLEPVTTEGSQYSFTERASTWAPPEPANARTLQEAGEWVELPFTFPFYDAYMNYAFVSPHGVLGFDGAPPAEPRGVPDAFTHHIAPLWREESAAVVTMRVVTEDAAAASSFADRQVHVVWEFAWPDGGERSFSLTLHDDGRFTMAYGPDTSGRQGGVISVSGNGAEWRVFAEGEADTHFRDSIRAVVDSENWVDGASETLCGTLARPAHARHASLGPDVRVDGVRAGDVLVDGERIATMGPGADYAIIVGETTVRAESAPGGLVRCTGVATGSAWAARAGPDVELEKVPTAPEWQHDVLRAVSVTHGDVAAENVLRLVTRAAVPAAQDVLSTRVTDLDVTRDGDGASATVTWRVFALLPDVRWRIEASTDEGTTWQTLDAQAQSGPFVETLQRVPVELPSTPDDALLVRVVVDAFPDAAHGTTGFAVARV